MTKEDGRPTAGRTGRAVESVTTVAVGVAMGAAEIVPGFSGGTVALITGIFPRLVTTIRQGAHVLSLVARLQMKEAWREFVAISWGFVVPLLGGMAVAIVTLSGVLSRFLDAQPAVASALFAGLVLAGALVAFGDLQQPRRRHFAIVVVVGVATFGLLGLAPGVIADPSWLLLFTGAAVAICAWILPGVSGAFLLLLMGLYPAALGAVADRDLVAVSALLAGAMVGIAGFATMLSWLLRRAHDVVLAAMVGLLLGSTRVLWPWPSHEGMGNPQLGSPESDTLLAASVAAAVAFVAVLLVARVARRLLAASND